MNEQTSQTPGPIVSILVLPPPRTNSENGLEWARMKKRNPEFGLAEKMVSEIKTNNQNCEN
jgi:hypothetical protein